MRLIVGLGNPGTRYRLTRHNVGFQCVDALSHCWNIPVNQRRPKVVLGLGSRAGEEIVLAKPRTFMNLSGDGVEYLLTRFAARLEDLIVVYDDMMLPLGRIRIRGSGGDGGHKGMQSIIEKLNNKDFSRVWLGIGAPPPEEDPVDYVLGRFSEVESPLVATAVKSVPLALDCLLEEGLEAAMNRFN